MWSNLLNVSESLGRFFDQIKDAINFEGFLAIALGVEVLFILLFAIKSVFSYEARLKRILDKANAWLFKYKKLNSKNIKAFNSLIKKGPKRFSYYWQQFILNRDGGPIAYMTEENIIEKPLRTSSWLGNVKNLTLFTVVWSIVSLLMGIASFSGQGLSFQSVAVALVLPIGVLILGAIAIVFIKGKRVLNLDDIYHLYHIFARFVTNACDELPPYIDFDLLFTPKEIENGNVQIRQYYEEKTRRAKEEFEQARKNEEIEVDYNFRDVGVDGALLLERAMKESEYYIKTKQLTQAQMAQIEAQRDALKRNYETVQMDLQRKLQASKENIQNLIDQQATTTNRFEVGRLRDRQDKEIKRQEGLQKDYDQEETRYLTAKDNLDKEFDRLRTVLDDALVQTENGMTAEYQTFFKKVMKSAYSMAEGKVVSERNDLIKDKDTLEQELISVQTQIKRMLDENLTLRAKVEQLNQEILKKDGENQELQNKLEENKVEGAYDEQGNFVYKDGSYHDVKGFFHDVDGRVYDLNGQLVIENELRTPEEINAEETKNEIVDNFGSEALTESQNIVNESVIEEPESTEDPSFPIFEEGMLSVVEPIEDEPLQNLEEITDTQTDTEEVTEEPHEEVTEEVPQEDVVPQEETEVVAEEVQPQEETIPQEETGAPQEVEAPQEESQEPQDAEKPQEDENLHPAEGKPVVVVDENWWEIPQEETPTNPEDIDWKVEEEVPREDNYSEEFPKVEDEDVWSFVEPEEQTPAEEPKEEPKKTPAKRQRKPRTTTKQTKVEPETKEEPKAASQDQPEEKKTRKPRTTAAKSTTTKPKTANAKPKTTTKAKPAKEEEPKIAEEEVKPAPETTEEPKTTQRRKPRRTSNAQRKKRAKPRKTVKKPEETAAATAPRKRGRPRKTTQKEDEVAKLNKLIDQEEQKLDNSKNQLTNDLDNATTESSALEKEKRDLVEAVEALKQQADVAKNGENNSSEDLSNINRRLEELINELASLNNSEPGENGEGSGENGEGTEDK